MPEFKSDGGTWTPVDKSAKEIVEKEAESPKIIKPKQEPKAVPKEQVKPETPAKEPEPQPVAESEP